MTEASVHQSSERAVCVCVCAVYACGKVLIYSFARVNQLFKDLHGK